MYEPGPQGEHFDVDMRRPLARRANRLLRGLRGQNTFIDLGEELGDVHIDHVRFRDAREQGQLIAYIRQEASDPKVIIPAIIALGTVAAGIYKLKHRKSS